VSECLTKPSYGPYEFRALPNLQGTLQSVGGRQVPVSIRRVVQSARTTHILLLLLLLLLVLLRNSDLTRMIDLAAHHYPPAVVRIAAAASSSSGTSSTRSSSGSSPHARTAPHRNLRMHLASRIAHLACSASWLAGWKARPICPRGGGGGCSSTPPLHAAANQSPAALPVAPTNGLTSQISRIPSHPFTDPGPRRAPFWPPLVQEQPRDGVSTLKTNLLSSSPMASHRFGRALADVTVT